MALATCILLVGIAACTAVGMCWMVGETEELAVCFMPPPKADASTSNTFPDRMYACVVLYFYVQRQLQRLGSS